jgi:hypothetical protein
MNDTEQRYYYLEWTNIYNREQCNMLIDTQCSLLGGECSCIKPIRDCKHLQNGSHLE